MKYRLDSFASIFAIAPVLGTALLFTACGGGNSSNNQSNNQAPPPAQYQSIQVNIGDSPSDRVIAFSSNISSMVLNNSNGTTTPVISAACSAGDDAACRNNAAAERVEHPPGHLYGRKHHHVLLSVTFMDPGTRTIMQKTIAGPITTNVPFSSNMSFSGTPMVLSFDMDMANSVAIDGSGNVTVNPTFHTIMNNVGAGSEHDPWNGMMEHMIGSVASVSGNSFGLSMMQSAQALNFTTSGNTQFQNISGMGMMSNGALMMVDAMLQGDGTVQAQNVTWFMGNGGVMSSGIVGSVTGIPATQMGVVVQDGSGQGMMSSFFANNATVNLTGSTSFNIDTDGIDMSNLPFTPMFDADHVYSGERVRCMSNIGMGSGGMGGGVGGMGGGGMMGTMNANQCDLVQQGLTGNVSNYAASEGQASFTLTLSSDSYFAIMTGANTITVYQQPGTELYGITGISNGQTVLIRGLMFRDGGGFRMVARRIMNP